jgi:hypothetical protein
MAHGLTKEDVVFLFNTGVWGCRDTFEALEKIQKGIEVPHPVMGTKTGVDSGPGPAAATYGYNPTWREKQQLGQQLFQ